MFPDCITAFPENDRSDQLNRSLNNVDLIDLSLIDNLFIMFYILNIFALFKFGLIAIHCV